MSPVWIHCNICSRNDKRIRPTLRITKCGTVFCRDCKDSIDSRVCQSCRGTCRSLPLNSQAPSEVKSLFRGIDSELESLLRASKFQDTQIGILLRHQKRERSGFEETLNRVELKDARMEQKKIKLSEKIMEVEGRDIDMDDKIERIRRAAREKIRNEQRERLRERKIRKERERSREIEKLRQARKERERSKELERERSREHEKQRKIRKEREKERERFRELEKQRKIRKERERKVRVSDREFLSSPLPMEVFRKPTRAPSSIFSVRDSGVSGVFQLNDKRSERSNNLDVSPAMFSLANMSEMSNRPALSLNFNTSKFFTKK